LGFPCQRQLSEWSLRRISLGCPETLLHTLVMFHLSAPMAEFLSQKYLSHIRHPLSLLEIELAHTLPEPESLT
jgi:hypothetical protein